MSYAPLPTTSEHHTPRLSNNASPHISLSALRSHITSFPSPSKPTFLEQLTPRTKRFAWIGGGAIVLLILISINHHTSTSTYSSPLESPRNSRLGEYKWMKGWSANKEGQAASINRDWNKGLLEPEFTRDEHTGYLMPPDVYPAALNP